MILDRADYIHISETKYEASSSYQGRVYYLRRHDYYTRNKIIDKSEVTFYTRMTLFRYLEEW